MQFTFQASLWVWDARRPDTWTFVTLPVDASEEIRERFGAARRGFGSVRVRATIGTSSWLTSIFPDKSRGAYVLPVKAAVRRAQRLGEGDPVTVRVEVVG